MKTGKFFKKATLAAAVCLSLSQSVWAMPSGGTVASGSVAGFSANPASGTTFTANGNSIINWNVFDIAAGESLTFNTANGALLNRVTGGSMSGIYGSLTQIGGHPLFIVNPSGIEVNGATINASNLVLSTLPISDSDFLAGAAGTQAYKFTDGGNYSGLYVTASEVNVTESLRAFANTIEIADGVTFSGSKITQIAALNNLTWTPSSNGWYLQSGKATEGNILNLENSSIRGAGANADSYIGLTGGNININSSTLSDATKIRMDGVASIQSMSEENSYAYTSPTAGFGIETHGLTIDRVAVVSLYGRGVNLFDSNIKVQNTSTKEDSQLMAATGFIDGIGKETSMTAADNDSSIYLKNTNITLETSGDTDSSLLLSAGTRIALDNSKLTLTGGNDNSINIYAINGYNPSTDTMTANIKHESGANEIEIRNGSVVRSNGERLEIVGGKIYVEDGSTVETTKGPVFIVANDKIQLQEKEGISTSIPVGVGTSGTLEITGGSKIIEAGKDVTSRFVDGGNISPVIPISANDRENIANGQAAMNNALSKATTPESRAAAAKELAETINRESTDSRAKAAQVSGVMLAIRENTSLSDAEKTSLQREVAQTFHPTQTANTEGNSTIDNTTQQGTATATGETQPKDINLASQTEEPIISGL